MGTVGRFAVAALASSALVGCASTAKGSKSSRFNDLSPVNVTLEQTAPPGTVLAVVRYPAYVDPDARTLYYDSFASRAIGERFDGRMRRKAKKGDYDPDTIAMADSVIIKSNYFALSLFKELAAKLPVHGVLLSPHAVVLDEDGESLTSEPMTAAESLPNVVRVDFAAYTFPDSGAMMGSRPLSFGDILTPMVSVRTDPRAAAATNGVLLASAPLMGQAVQNGVEARTETLADLQNGTLGVGIPELDFVSYLDGDPDAITATAKLRSGITENAASMYGVEKIKMDKNVILALGQGEEAGTLDPLDAVWSEGFADQIVAVINDLDVEKAAMLRRAANIAQFDDNLAALSVLGSAEPDYLGRMRYAERLLDAQRKYMSVQSLRLFDGIHNGEMGAQMRDMLKAEYDILARRRKLANEQNIALASAAALLVARSATAPEPGTYVKQTDRLLNSMVGNVAFYAINRAWSARNQSKAVAENYLSSIVPALETTAEVQVDLIDSNETITAIRYEDLQEQLQDLYAENQRALDTVATRCAYTHDGDAKVGTWMGVCADGVASGPGIGVYPRADGSTVEYYGHAQAGRPDGVGYMIVHAVDGASTAYEGTFRSGRPDGTVVVSQSGRPDTAREFQMGRDVGPARTRPQSPFAKLEG